LSLNQRFEKAKPITMPIIKNQYNRMIFKDI